MREKIKKVLSWIGIGLCALFLIALLGTIEYTKTLQKYRVTAPGINDICSTIESSSCGMSLKDCNSEKEYKCVTNVSVEPIR